MKSIQTATIALLFISLSCSMLSAQDSDQSLQPYFKIISKSSNSETLPLKSSKAEVTIAGVISDVTIKQVFQNNGVRPIEAVYVFPGSTRAAVYDLEMKVNGRIIKAIVQEKEQARKTYNQAKSSGKRTTLLEQQRPNVFTMNVANIQSGEEIEVVLRYTERNKVSNGEYTFVYPGVVGPRFTGESGHVADVRPGIPYAKKTNSSLYDFDLNVFLNAGMPIQDICSPTHKIDVSYKGLNKAKIELSIDEEEASNRDYILKYRLAGEQIASGLLLHESEKDNHFMLAIQPPQVVRHTDVPNREYIFVVDVSGSMNGFPLDVTKTLMRNLLTNMREGDQFNVMLFASKANVYHPSSVPATTQHINNAIAFLNSTGGGGGTRLLNALNRVIDLPGNNLGLSRSVVVITDGYISVEKEVFDLMRMNNNKFNFFSFGIGSSVNRYLIEGIAHVGNSEPVIITKKDEANEKAEQFRKYISTPVLTDIKVDWGGFDVYDLEPSNFSDVLSERPIIVTGKYRNEPPGVIKLSGISGEESYNIDFDASQAKASSDNKAVKYLWAREKIRLLDDYQKVDQNSETALAVTQLGLQYNLLTNYTSFVAVDQEVIKEEFISDHSNAERVEQPLPLPKGVSSFSIGGSNATSSAVGAEFIIKGMEKDGVSYKYHVISEDLSEVEILFVELELGYMLTKVFSKMNISKKNKINLQIRINKDGILSVLNKHAVAFQYSSIVEDIEGRQIKFRKDSSVDVELSIN